MEIYEGIYIINPNLSEENIKDIVLKINDIFSHRDCSVLQIEDWGVKPLAYEINDLSFGHYLKITVNGDLESVTEFNAFCGNNDYILRYVLMKKN